MKRRTVSLLSSEISTSINPAEWHQIQGAKEFDAKSTETLRVFRHRDPKTRAYEERFMVYGMKSTKDAKALNGQKVVETYEFTALTDLLPSVVAKVAKHCGIDGLVDKMRSV